MTVDPLTVATPVLLDVALSTVLPSDGVSVCVAPDERLIVAVVFVPGVKLIVVPVADALSCAWASPLATPVS